MNFVAFSQEPALELSPVNAGVEVSSESLKAFQVPYNRTSQMIGYAYWKDRDELAYTEEHTFYFQGQKRVKVSTVYRNPSGEPFADFVSDYTQDPYVPAYRFRDQRFGRIEGLQWLDEGQIQLYGKKYADKKLKTKTIKAPKVGFAGQGLNFFIVDNFQKFSSLKRPVEVDFVVPLALKSYGFRIRPKESKREGVTRLRAEIDNWFIRLFAPSIDVVYDTDKKVLLEYRGPSNLLSNSRDIEPVVIKYRWPEPSGPQARTSDQIDRAGASTASGRSKEENP